MAGPVTAKYRLVTKTFAAYHAEVIRLLKKHRTPPDESDDASLIGTYDWTGLLKPARDDLAAHIARKDNPHQETMNTHGSYTETQVRAKLDNKVPNAVLPISHYGVLDELTDAQIDAAWSASGWILSCNVAIQCALSGTVYNLPAQAIDLRTLDTAPANKTFNVYVRTQFGLINYEARSDSPPESVSVMFIGRCTTNASGIVSKLISSVVRVDSFRLSGQPVGSAIPLTGGTYTAPVKLTTAWNP